MEVRSNGGEDFRRLGVKFRAAGKDGAAMRKALTAAIRKELDKITAEQKRRAIGMRVKGVRGKGSSRRESYHQAHRKRAARGGHGLRASVARGIKSKVSYSGRKLGARVSADPSGLPQSQRKLPRYLNKPKGWRHPVWGNRERWVQQVGEEYFTEPIERLKPEVQKAVYRAVYEVLEQLK